MAAAWAIPVLFDQFDGVYAIVADLSIPFFRNGSKREGIPDQLLPKGFQPAFYRGYWCEYLRQVDVIGDLNISPMYIL